MRGIFGDLKCAMSAEIVSELLACPRCDKSPLSSSSNSYRCDACKIDFPAIGDIPWLFAEPDATLGEWRSRLHFALQQQANESQRLKSELAAQDLPSLTIQRLELQLKATDEHRSTLRQLLSPVDIQSMQASYESYLALRTRLPSDQGINTYYANIHRDWAWGDSENAASIEQIKAVMQSGDGNAASLGDTLVLGAGACRLAYDVHMQLGTARTIATDFNPLLLLIAKKMTEGQTEQLYEFPLAPKTMEDFAALRTLSAPEAVREDFFLVAGDVLRPPFAKERFDTVITPWIIDIVDEDLGAQAARINGLLKPSGRWINFGSLAFNHANRSRCYSVEETLSIVEDAGFSCPSTREESIPYMCSPASRHGRQETVFTFSATKIASAAAIARHKALPDWIVTGKEAVPLLQSFKTQALSTQIYSFIMSLIDGKRTITDMATVLEQQKLMTSKEAVPAIRNFLIRMYEDSKKGTGL